MTKFDTYRNVFPHAELTRSPKGILEVVLHIDGATLVFNGSPTRSSWTGVANSLGNGRRKASGPRRPH
jgi:hypothetical protein